jgi:hypothetical protein
LALQLNAFHGWGEERCAAFALLRTVPPPAFGRLLLHLRKANAAQHFHNQCWHAMTTHGTVLVGR